MADKKVNRLLLVGVIAAIGLVALVTCSDKEQQYAAIQDVPRYQEASTPKDGDTTTDTIKALQAYAKAAVAKAETLQNMTEERLAEILENKKQVEQLTLANQDSKQQQQKARAMIDTLEKSLDTVRRELNVVQQSQSGPALNADGLPVGFGFDDARAYKQRGSWYDAADVVNDASEQSSNRFSPLLASKNARQLPSPLRQSVEAAVPVEPVYTLPKDSILTDATALTALIGRIPVKGITPDPYPVKLFIGKQNLAANGHDIPEIEGMIFSGLGLGDWNLSCVSARLYSATYIFTDGSIVNHTTDEPLGYISDPNGVPCVSGRFVSNAPAFLAQRIGLAAVGAAGAAYAEAQQQTQTSALTGTTTSIVVGDLKKLATGEAVQSASDEISRWLLERQQQSFDAVVVNPGTAVSIHLNTRLAIDYDTTARKIRYERTDKAVSTLD